MSVGRLRNLALALLIGGTIAPRLASAAPRAMHPGRPAARKPTPPPPMLLSLSVSPSEIALPGPRAERQMLVTGRFSDGVERDLTDHVRYVSGAPKVGAVTRSGLVTGVSDGTALVKAVIGKFVAGTRVSVKETASEAKVSFNNDVVPVLNRAGCNQGACHGAQYGKGSFKLSLLGYDPDADYKAIREPTEGRRIMKSDPPESLLLKKALLVIPHGGGMRFKPDSYEYRTLVSWIAGGMPAPLKDEPGPASVDVEPSRRLMRLGAAEAAAPIPLAVARANAKPLILKWTPRQRLVAVARFKDGRAEDVTRKVQFNSLNDGIAQVGTDGRVTLLARGETSVMVRYRGKATVARFTMPYRDLASFPDVPKASFIDELVAARWKEMGLLPSGKCTDQEFIRRAYLDALGVLPAPEEVRTFMASTDPEKRQKLVDAVLARPEYVDYWTLKWGDLLRNSRDKLGDKGMWSFYNWLRASFRENKPVDQLARELVTAQGSTYTVGPANFFRVARTPADLAETTSQVFLGIRLACAKCHHHPFEKWSQDDYWQMAAFFSRVGLKNSDEFGIFGQEQVVRVNASGEVSNPRTGKQMMPAPLDGEPTDDAVDRRRALAGWLTGPQNGHFSRNIVNRYWGYLMGRGIVDPVDDMRVTNPPSNPELLDALAREFTEHKFDLKHLLRTIMTSEVYQLSSQPTRDNRQDEVFFTKYTLKRMAAEELLDAINFATGAAEKFPNLPLGMRAVQLPDPGVQSPFLDIFGRPPREIACECERQAEPNMAQALHLMNGDFVQGKIAAPQGRLAKLLAANKPEPEIVDELYLVTFSRPPTPAELAQGQALVQKAPNKKEGFEDLLWALLNSREFMLKH
jgi:hypothetical protein